MGVRKNYIYLFRHGQTTYNRDHVFTGWKDAKLTKLGLKQAKEIAKQLKNKKIDLAIQTKLSRSKNTLKEVLKFHPECKKILTDNRMIERSYGDLSGKKHSDIIKKYGQKQFNCWHRGYNKNCRPPGKTGECFEDVEKRVKLFIKDLKKIIKKEKVNVAISAHGNSIRLFRKIWEDLTVECTTKFSVPYDKVFTYTVRV